jgi:hypothetical protein
VPPSTSSPTTVVATSRPTGSPPQGPAINVFSNYGGGPCQTRRQQPPRGAYNRHIIQLLRWLLLDLPTAPPREPSIDVFSNYHGGYCWIY